MINIVPEKNFVDLYLREVNSDISRNDRLIKNLYPEKRVNHRSSKLGWLKYIQQYGKFFIKVYSYLGKLSPSIVVLHTPSIQLLGVLLKLLCRKHTFICFCHGTFSNPNLNSFKQKIIIKIEKIILLKFSKVICVSKHLADTMLLSGKKSIEVFICPPGILLPDEKISIKNQLPSVVKKIGFVGRINRDKGLDDIIKIKKKLEISYPKIKYLVFGAIEDPGLARELKLNRIDLKGFIDDKSKIYQSFDLLLFPSKREGLPLVAIEAVRFGRPIIGYNILGLRDAIENGVTGELVEPFNFEKLFEAVLKIIEDKNLFRWYVKNCDFTSRNYAKLESARSALREFITQ